MLSGLLSLGKVLLKSGLPSPAPQSSPERDLIIMGNGPSLRSFLNSDPAIYAECDLMAVNFAAITPEFFTLRPHLYILADPHFFKKDNADTKVAILWENLSKADWPIILYLPANASEDLINTLSAGNPHITIRRYNLTPVEGDSWLSRTLIKSGLGMPRPRNVLIPAIMMGMRAGYRRIYLVGADHTWSQSLWVDEKNRVVSVQPHYYKDNKEEEERVAAEYAGYHLHDILNSLTIAFRSYHDIARIAARENVEIINATPGSFIDAFPRCDYSGIGSAASKKVKTEA